MGVYELCMSSMCMMRVCVCVSVHIYLMSINSDGNQCEDRDVNGAILCKAAYMAHYLPKHPCTVNKPHLGTDR